MGMTVDATFEKGVFVPARPPALPEHQRVRLTVEPCNDAGAPTAGELIEKRRSKRIQLDPDLADEIATSPELDPNES